MQTYKVTVADQGTIQWYDQEGKRHREGGPAIEWTDGDKFWYWHGEHHREGGPAIEYANGTKEWCWHGQWHREDGPAIQYADGTKEWYLHGKSFVNEEAWKRAKQAKQAEASSSCEGKVVEIDGKKYKLTLV